MSLLAQLCEETMRLSFSLSLSLRRTGLVIACTASPSRSWLVALTCHATPCTQIHTTIPPPPCGRACGRRREGAAKRLNRAGSFIFTPCTLGHDAADLSVA